MRIRQYKKLGHTELDLLQEQRLQNLNAIQEQQDRLVEEVEDLKRQKAYFEKHIDYLKNQSIDSDNHLKNTINLRKEEENKYQSIYSELSELEAKKLAFEEEFAKEKQEAEEKLINLQSDYQSKDNQLKIKLDEKTNQLNELIDRYSSSESTYIQRKEESNELRIDIRDKKDVIKGLNFDIERIDGEVKDLTTQKLSLSKIVDDLKSEHSDFPLQITELEEEARHKRIELDIIKRDINISTNKLKDLQSKFLGLMSRDQSIDELKLKIDGLFS